MDFKKSMKFLSLKGWILLFGMLLGFLLAFFLIVSSWKNNALFLSIYVLGIVLLILLLGVIGILVTNTLLKFNSLKEAKKYPKKNSHEVAIILGYDAWQGYFISTYLGIKYLLKYLKLKNKRVAVYITPTKKEFNKILANNKIKIIYLIGHGSSRGFTLNKKEMIYYSDYKGSKIVKDQIHLYHCGHGEGKTLIDHLVKKENRKKCHRHYKKERVIFYVNDFYDLYEQENKQNDKKQKLKTQESNNK